MGTIGIGIITMVLGVYFAFKLNPHTMGIPIGISVAAIGGVIIYFNLFIIGIVFLLITLSLLAWFYKRGSRVPEDSPDY